LASANATSNQSLDVKQTGNGIAPIFGVHYRVCGFDFAAKYEFKTKITLTNETKEDATGMYPDGKKLRSDVPAILSLAGSYDITPNVKVSVTYLHHFEKQATFETWVPTDDDYLGGFIAQRQKLINGNTNEYKAGVEWKLNDKLTLSTGFQYSDVNVFDTWQNDIAHNLDNFTVGLGFAYRITDRLTLNFGAINTWYTPSSVTGVAGGVIPYKQTYDRTNRAIAVGVDYRF
ncbi:MAG: TonB-dependent receptor, partial [Bacteroidales bacterium]|jgi:long-chain fatty acid transport protein|nr:TonB-dependent receptor [Bacteroidales bacterium]